MFGSSYKGLHVAATQSHPLYGPFMSHLSVAIFEWDSRDTLGKSTVMQLFYSCFMTLQSSH